MSMPFSPKMAQEEAVLAKPPYDHHHVSGHKKAALFRARLNVLG
jgi:hypothetical protein